MDRGFSGNPYEAGKGQDIFIWIHLPQEYTAYGNGDYRINGLETEQADGSDTANLKYESYEIYKRKIQPARDFRQCLQRKMRQRHWKSF